MTFFPDYFAAIADCVQTANENLLLHAANEMRKVRERKGKVILIGNGGSAAMASHVAVDLTKVAGVRAVNFNEADLLTCLANDYGYERWVEQALHFYADPVDLVVLISSSGRSANILNGALKAKHMKLPVITLSGFEAENPLRKLGDLNLWANSRAYNVVEMTHHIWLLALVDKLVADRESHT